MRCPVCKAENHQGPQCRRCKADLVLLFTLEEQRLRALTKARRYLAEEQWHRAAECAEESERIRTGEDARRIQAVAHLLDRNFSETWRIYCSRLQAESE